MINAIVLSLVLAQVQPLPRAGVSCPLGYYVSGNYCVPSPNNKTQQALQKEGRSCPLGFYSSGNYCAKSYGY